MEKVKLGLEIRQTSKAVKQYVQNEINENFKENDVHITLSEGMVLHYVDSHPDDVVTAKVLLKKYGLSKATMSQILTSLLRKGMIHYEVCKKDGRLKRIVLTKKAMQLQSDINTTLAESDDFFMEAFTQEESETLCLLLARLREHILTTKEKEN